MVIRKERTVRKRRGSKWHGAGAKKKHRGSGSIGGHGFAGSLSHNKIYVQKNFPNHIGKKGFARPEKTNVRNKTINVSDLEKLANGNKEVDLTKMGYGKLLAKGQINVPLKITIASYSTKAKEKIEQAGGSIVE